MSNESKTLNTEYLVEKLLLTDSDKDILEELKFLRYEKLLKPAIFVEISTSGIAAGARKTFEKITNYLEERKIDADLVEVGSLGFCSVEPIISVQLQRKNRVFFQNVSTENVEAILDGIFSNNIPKEFALGEIQIENCEPWDGVPFLNEIPFFAKQNRVISKLNGIISPININEYLSFEGYLSFSKVIKNYSPTTICEWILESGLRGRGGGGFLTGEKWKIAYNSPKNTKFLICNADESDPGGFMNRLLFESNPHLLIEGMLISAFVIGAKKVFVYIRGEYSLAIERLRKAILDAKNCGLIGENILKTNFSVDIEVREGAGSFVCGEETALISSIAGKRGIPRVKPPYPATEGLFENPTVVNNVETLANIPFIIKNGPQWFQKIGTQNSKGTKIFTLSGKIKNSGLVEIPFGTSIREIIFDIGEGIKNNAKFKAAQLGGPTGHCLPEEQLDTIVDFEALTGIGATLGLGGMIVMDENICMVDITKFFMEFIQRESCGKCISCREGTRRMFEILESVTRRPLKEMGFQTLERFKGVMQLESLSSVIKETTMCGLGLSAPNTVISTLKWFRDEFEEHIFDRKCRAGVCRELRTFYINVNLCTGCTICIRKCPKNAIIGTIKHPHFVVEEKCTGCGVCFEICKFGAVFMK